MHNKYFFVFRSAGYAFSIVLLTVICWMTYRYYEYSRFESFRNGISALKKEDYITAHRLISPFAESGYSPAQKTLGYMYAFGMDVPVNEDLAMIWFRRSECNGCSVTGRHELDVAFDYLRGFSGKQDPEIALQWLRRSAKAGNSTAMEILSNGNRLNELGFK